MPDCKLLSLHCCAGFNVETIKYKGVNFNTWDTGGRDKSVSNDFSHAHRYSLHAPQSVKNGYIRFAAMLDGVYSSKAPGYIASYFCHLYFPFSVLY